MNCPHCPHPLGSIDTAQGPTVDFCTHCGGTWYDDGELEAVLGLPRQFRIHRAAFDPAPGPDCPRCTTEMEEVSWPEQSPVRVDVCRSCHGVWLDRSELAQLRTAKGKPPTSHPVPQEEGIYVVPIRAGRAGFQLGTFLSAVVVMGACTGAALGALTALGALDHLRDTDSTGVASISTIGAVLLGIPIGAAVTGRVSAGFTIWEPTAASIPVLAGVWWFFSSTLSPLELVAVSVAGMVLAVPGAVLGERLQEG